MISTGTSKQPLDATHVEVVVHGHDGGEVAEAVAVVGRAPDGRELLAEEHLEALHAELVRAAHVVQLVQVQELVHHVLAEDVAGAARGLRGQVKTVSWSVP